MMTQMISNASFGTYFQKLAGTFYDVLPAPVRQQISCFNLASYPIFGFCWSFFDTEDGAFEVF